MAYLFFGILFFYFLVCICTYFVLLLCCHDYIDTNNNITDSNVHLSAILP